MSAMLEVKDLEVSYGKIVAVKGISFSVDEGEVVTLIGTNGAGKTTTLRTISGLLRPSGGEIRFRGDRIDTTAAHQIVGMGEAFRIAKEEMAAENQRITALRDRFYRQLEGMEELYVNGSLTARVPHNLNLSFNYVEGESLIMALKDLAVSSGSACTSASLEPSYVLRALGRNDELAHSSIRFTFGRFTTEEEVDYAAAKVREAVDKLRELSPLWDMFKEGVDLSSVEWAAH